LERRTTSDESHLVNLLNRARDARDELLQKYRTDIGVIARAQVESWLQNVSDGLEFDTGRFPIDDPIRFDSTASAT